MLDRKTRGRTSPTRLRALDAYLVRTERELLAAPPPQAAFVDLGFGEHPWTTLASATALRAISPALRVLGVERDPDRVAAAQRHQDPQTRFVQGGFAELAALGPARIVRAMNVLRTYPEPEAREAHELLSAPLIEGGLGLEGSADPEGALLTCHLLRRRGPDLLREGLLFFSDFSRGFAPIVFRDWLPRDLRRRVRPGEWIREIFDLWTDEWERVRAHARDPREAFVASVNGLAQRVPGVDASMAEEGFFILRPREGVPRVGIQDR